MSDLHDTVRQAQSDLSEIYLLVQKTCSGVSSPAWLSVQTNWIGKARLYEDLGETSKLLVCRDDAMKCLEDLRDNVMKMDSESLSVQIQYGTTKMAISSARVLAFDSYLATTWSIYDRLSNVLGRLMGDAKITENSNPAQNPKLVENLISQTKGCFHAFGMNELLPKLYGEAILTSYFLRNSFMHDGGYMDNIPILSGSSTASCFEVSSENAKKINDIITTRLKEYQEQGCRCAGFVRDKDLVDQLKAWHADLDKMFVSLVEFVVRAFCGQVLLFCERIGINPAANAELGGGAS